MPIDATAPPPPIHQTDASGYETRTSTLEQPSRRDDKEDTATAQGGMEPSFQISKRLERRLVRDSMVPMLNELLQRHQALVEKKLSDVGLEREESMELRRIRWQLDRIDDAVEGDHFDLLELAVRQQKALASEVAATAAMIQQRAPRAVPGPRGGKKKRR